MIDFLYILLLCASALVGVTGALIASTWWRLPITDPVPFWLLVGLLIGCSLGGFVLWWLGQR